MNPQFPGTQLMDILVFFELLIYSTLRKRKPLTRNEVPQIYLGHFKVTKGLIWIKVERGPLLTFSTLTVAPAVSEAKRNLKQKLY